MFTLKPVTHTIGDFLEMLRMEDAGIDRAVVRNTEGVRISSTTSIQTLLQTPSFDLESLSKVLLISSSPPLKENGFSAILDLRHLVGAFKLKQFKSLKLLLRDYYHGRSCKVNMWRSSDDDDCEDIINGKSFKLINFLENEISWKQTCQNLTWSICTTRIYIIACPGFQVVCLSVGGCVRPIRSYLTAIHYCFSNMLRNA